MWKRIRSNRDLRDTLFSELRKELRPYYDRSRQCLNAFAKKRPRLIFASMVILLLVSVAISFTLQRQPEVRSGGRAKILQTPVIGIDAIMSTSLKIDQVIRLKQRIDSLAHKGQLSGSDSLSLNNALDSLERIQRTLQTQHHEY